MKGFLIENFEKWRKKLMGESVTIILIGSNNFDPALVTKVWSLNPIEVIVILSNSENKELISYLKSKECKVIVKEETGQNEGYIAALNEAIGDIFLFINSNDSTIQTEQIELFLEPIISSRADVVLNNISPSFLQKRVKQWPDCLTLCRQVFNDSLGFNHFLIDSLLSLPHAFTKKVKKSLGTDCYENLVVAHLKILENDFNISRHISIESQFIGNHYTPEQSHYTIPISDTEIKELNMFLEAWIEWFRIHGERGNYHDGGRRRDIVEDIKKSNKLSDYATIHMGSGRTSSLYGGKQLSIVIPAQNEETTIGAVISQARLAEPLEIIVVVNGSNDKTEEIAKQYGTTVLVFEEALGIDVGRAIGALFAKGDILLFIDADFPIHFRDLQQFGLSVANGADIALNDLNIDYFPLYVVNLYKYLLNMICNCKELGVGSLVAVPHAISRSCLNGIGWDSLINPNLAHVKGILQGYKLENVHFVDVMKPNRIRPDQHFSKLGHPKAVLRIIGDHLEAIAYLCDKGVN